MTEWLGLPPLATAHGGQIDNLIGWIHIFMFILFVGWGGFFLFTPRAFPASRGTRSPTTRGSPRTGRPTSKSVSR